MRETVVPTASRTALDRAERSSNLYSPIISMGLIYVWMLGALVPIAIVAIGGLLIQEAGLYVGELFAGRQPDPFGSSFAKTAAIFNGQLTFLDATRLASPLFWLKTLGSIGGSVWLIVRLLRHRIGLVELLAFTAIFAFNLANILLALADITATAIDQLFLPLTAPRGKFELLEAIFLFGNVVFLIWVMVHAVTAYLGVEQLSEWEVRICAHEPKTESGWRSVSSRLFGVPRNIGVAARRARTILLMYFANVSTLVPMILVFGAIPSIIYANINFVKLMAGAFELNRTFEAAGNSMDLHFWLTPPYQLIVLIGVEALKAAVLLFIAQQLRARGLNYLRTSLLLAQRRDQRKPVLFLRPFLADSIPLATPPKTLLDRLFSIPTFSATLDGLVLDEGSSRGPVVAVGAPSEAPPLYGSSRGYFGHQNWQSAVASLAVDAGVIVAVVGGSDGVRWEMDHLAASGHLSKTLFIGPPNTAENDRIAVRAFLVKLGCEGPDVDRNLIAFWMDDQGAFRQVTSRAFSATSYRLAIRLFLRDPASKNGKPESAPAAFDDIWKPA